jgi:hypothetical protein
MAMAAWLLGLWEFVPTQATLDPQRLIRQAIRNPLLRFFTSFIGNSPIIHEVRRKITSVLKFRLKPKLKLERIVDHHLHVNTVF